MLAATAPAATVSSAGVVNLLPLIDVDADTMAGRWRFEEGHLLSDASSFARIRIRYAPPEEYDFRIEFARLAGKDDVAQIFDVQGQRSVWQMSGGLGREWGLGGRMGRIIPVPSAPRIVTGQRHVSLVRVRRGSPCRSWLST